MKAYDPLTVADHASGRVDAIDVLTLVFDSGVMRLALGMKGQLIWDDDLGQLPPWQIGPDIDSNADVWDDSGVWDDDSTWAAPAAGENWNDAGYWRDDLPWSGSIPPDPIYYGTGSLVSLDVPESALGSESRVITATLYETYMVEGSDIPVNVFDDGVRATIDEENWQGRTAILGVFWLNLEGAIVDYEQVAIRQMDAMPLEWDDDGNPMRKLMLEEADIIQRDIEGTTSNAAFQALIDPTDRAFDQVGVTKTQKINFGRRPEDVVA